MTPGSAVHIPFLLEQGWDGGGIYALAHPGIIFGYTENQRREERHPLFPAYGDKNRTQEPGDARVNPARRERKKAV